MGKKVPNELARPVMQRMSAYLKANKVSQTEIAREILGGTPDYMNNRLTCKLEMTVAEYVAICDYLKVPYSQFMTSDVCEKCGRAVDNVTSFEIGNRLLCVGCYEKYVKFRVATDEQFFKKGAE